MYRLVILHKQTQKKRSDFWLLEKGAGKLDEGGQKVQNSTYAMCSIINMINTAVCYETC